jgi:hypothetical protein
MTTGSDIEQQKLKEQPRQVEEGAGQAERVPRDEQTNLLRAERQVQEEQTRNENTIFRDILKLCHSLLFRPILIQADKTLTTKRSITNPKGRKCPTFLRPWYNFATAQLQYFGEVWIVPPVRTC